MPHPPRPYDPGDYDASSVKLERFIKAAQDQIGDKYRFGAEASEDDANPTSFDSSELVEWAAHRAGFHDMPDGSWNQYRYLHEQGASLSVEDALKIKGALVFGFSSDPTDSPDRPARAYVGISMGDGKSVLDVSERSGQVRVMDHGGFYNYAATIPEFHTPDEQPVTDLWEDRDGNGRPDVWDERDRNGATDDPLPDSIAIDTDGDGIPDSSLPRPSIDGGIDTDGDGIPDSSVAEPDPLGPRPGQPVLVPDGRTTQDGPGDIIYEPSDDPVAPAAPAAPSAPEPGDGPRSQVFDQDLPGEDLAAPTELTASYPDGPAPGDQVAYAETSDFADDAGYGADSYSDSYADPSTDLSAEV